MPYLPRYALKFCSTCDSVNTTLYNENTPILQLDTKPYEFCAPKKKFPAKLSPGNVLQEFLAIQFM